MITVEVSGAIDSAGTLKTFYLSNTAFASAATDTPANTAFEPTIKDPGTFAYSIVGDGRLFGEVRLDVGEIVISNANGTYDSWLDYGFEGRPVVVRQGEAGQPYPASFKVLFSGIVASVTINRQSLGIRVKDTRSQFESQLLTTHYAGTNTLPNGIEGGADLRGKVKPVLFGKVRNVTPPCVNTSKLIYQVSKLAVESIEGVFDKGVALTAGTNHGTQAALEAATVAGGTYQTCRALGLIRLGGTPAGQVTVDATEGATAADRTAGAVIQKLALLSGLASSQIDATSMANLSVANPAPVGIYIADERSTLEAIGEVAKSVGAWFGFASSGKLTVDILTAPTGLPVFTITEHLAGNATERRPLRDLSSPAYRVKVNYSRNFTKQANELAGSVTVERRGLLAEDYLAHISEDVSVKAKWPLAEMLEVDTLLVNLADAQAEANRLLALHKVRRDAFEVPLSAAEFARHNAQLSSCIALQIGRFGLNGGRLLRVLGIRHELGRNRTILTLWG